MVTKGYQKGVYERVTKGIGGGTEVTDSLIECEVSFAPAGLADATCF